MRACAAAARASLARRERVALRHRKGSCRAAELGSVGRHVALVAGVRGGESDGDRRAVGERHRPVQ